MPNLYHINEVHLMPLWKSRKHLCHKIEQMNQQQTEILLIGISSHFSCFQSLYVCLQRDFSDILLFNGEDTKEQFFMKENR
jgi:hypothetical protein